MPPIPLRQQPWHWRVLFYTENEKQLFLSFQEYQKNKKMVPSPCGPKAPSALSLSATLVAIVLCFSLRRFSNLFHCCCFRPMRISYNCPSPATDQDKSSGGATQKNPREAKSGSPSHLSALRVLHTPCFAASQSPAEGLVCSLWGGCLTLLMSQVQLFSCFLHHQLWDLTGTSSYQQLLLPGSTKASIFAWHRFPKLCLTGLGLYRIWAQGSALLSK